MAIVEVIGRMAHAFGEAILGSKKILWTNIMA